MSRFARMTCLACLLGTTLVCANEPCRKPCQTAPTKIVVEVSPPEVVFERTPAKCQPKKAESPRASASPAPAASPSYTAYATYYQITATPMYSVPTGVVTAAPGMAMVPTGGYPTFGPPAGGFVPTAPASFGPAGNPPRDQSPAAALAAHRAYVEADLKERLKQARDEQQALANQLSALPPLPTTSGGRQEGLAPTDQPALAERVAALEKKVDTLLEAVTAHHAILKSKGLIPAPKE